MRYTFTQLFKTLSRGTPEHTAHTACPHRTHRTPQPTTRRILQVERKGSARGGRAHGSAHPELSQWPSVRPPSDESCESTVIVSRAQAQQAQGRGVARRSPRAGSRPHGLTTVCPAVQSSAAAKHSPHVCLTSVPPCSHNTQRPSEPNHGALMLWREECQYSFATWACGLRPELHRSLSVGGGFSLVVQQKRADLIEFPDRSCHCINCQPKTVTPLAE